MNHPITGLAGGVRRSYMHVATTLAHLGPLTLLLMRLWVAWAFWQAGVVKFVDPTGTQYLFNYVYHVPLLSGDTAAFLGTWIELITPWLLGLGILARPTAVLLFVYNIITVVSYPDLWPHGFWAGLFGADFNDHKIWGLMLLAVIAWGPGTLSLDGLFEWLVWRRRPVRAEAAMPEG